MSQRNNLVAGAAIALVIALPCSAESAEYFVRIRNMSKSPIHYAMNGQMHTVAAGYTAAHQNRDGRFNIAFDHSFESGYQRRSYFLRANSMNAFRAVGNGTNLYWDGKGGILPSQLPLSFPVKASTPYQKIASRGKMKTSLSIDANGTIRGLTKLRVTGGVKGFTGGLSLALLGENDSWLGDVTVGRWGIDPNIAFWSSQSGRRNVSWTKQVPRETLQRLRRVVIIQSHKPKSRLDNIKRSLNKGRAIADVVAANGGWIAAL